MTAVPFSTDWIFAGLTAGLLSGVVRRWSGQIISSMTRGGE